MQKFDRCVWILIFLISNSFVILQSKKKMSIRDNPYWNIILLALAWALTLSTSTLLTTVGPLAALNLGASNSLSAFTIGVFLIGAALSSVPSGWLFRTYGRFWGFTFGCIFQFIGSALGTLALSSNQQVWLYLGCFSIGLAQGLGQFYRFSAVEITPGELKSRAITYVLSGGIIAAFLGPTSASASSNMIGEEYMGSFIMVAIFAFLNLIVIALVRFPPVEPKDNKDVLPGSVSSQVEQHPDIRPMKEIVTQPIFMLACTIATLAHTIMVMVMSNVTVSMKDNNFSISTCSVVMEIHFFSMFAPGFFSGKLIEKYGSFVVAMIGGVMFAGSSVILATGIELWNYMVGMSLVGFAWNLSFSAGTVMLTTCYKVKENSFCVFSIQRLLLFSFFFYSQKKPRKCKR
jgi:MFS family permease